MNLVGIVEANGAVAVPVVAVMNRIFKFQILHAKSYGRRVFSGRIVLPFFPSSCLSNQKALTIPNVPSFALLSFFALLRDILKGLLRSLVRYHDK
jgi:hypothetical protein